MCLPLWLYREGFGVGNVVHLIHIKELIVVYLSFFDFLFVALYPFISSQSQRNLSSRKRLTTVRIYPLRALFGRAVSLRSAAIDGLIKDFDRSTISEILGELNEFAVDIRSRCQVDRLFFGVCD
jgi:hypothetical protein